MNVPVYIYFDDKKLGPVFTTMENGKEWVQKVFFNGARTNWVREEIQGFKRCLIAKWDQHRISVCV